MSSQSQSLDWVQALRGTAALAVVMCHARYFYQGSVHWNVADSWLKPGAFGVDLFFMVSGFIMVYSTRDAVPTTRYVIDFFIKRFSRIWPIYAVMTVAWAVLSGMGAYHAGVLEKLAGIVKSLLFLPVHPDQVLYFGTTLPVGWSLNFEMYFYLVFGVCLLFGRWRWLALFIWMSAALIFLPAAFHQLSFDVWRKFHFPLTYLDLIANPIIVEFLVGILICFVYQSPKIRFSGRRPALAICSAAVISAVVYVWHYLGPSHGLTNWGWPIAVAFLSVALLSKEVDIVVPAALRKIGEISFSLYLLHGFVHAVARAVLPHSVFASPWLTGLVVVVTTLVSIGGSLVSHRVLEVGLSDIVKRRLQSYAEIMFRRRASLASQLEKP